MSNFQNVWFTVICVLIIIGYTIYGFIKAHNAYEENSLIINKRKIERLPSVVSTLGVLGTFLGITIGLLGFDSSDLNSSIPTLLNGLKTAFFTSLAGMFCSLCLSKYICSIFDNKEEGVSDINNAASEIVKAVRTMSYENKETLGILKDQAIKQHKDALTFYRSVSEVLTKVLQNVAESNTNSNALILHTQQQTSCIQEIKEGLGNMSVALGNIDENTEKHMLITKDVQEQSLLLNSKIKETSNSISEIVDIASALSTTQEDVAAEVKSFGEKLHGEVVEIEDKMQETNKLLTLKFDEFTELLKKSNTEALVEVMKKVTEEFQKSMNELIGKLIQENFEQLNNSVEKLNTWQQENKQMISSLTSQYKQMTTNFENTSTTLTKVGDDTKALVSDGGKLKLLIETLNKVMIEDDKFIKITSYLTDAVSLTKENMTEFESSTKSLNDWVRKQRNFVDGVQALIAKLEELNKLRDYNEEFWQGTKRSLEEGVNYIAMGSKSLNDQLVKLDEKFYARLGATLAELDTCIQAMVRGRR